jgi:hypothetical protein
LNLLLNYLEYDDIGKGIRIPVSISMPIPIPINIIEKIRESRLMVKSSKTF